MDFPFGLDLPVFQALAESSYASIPSNLQENIPNKRGSRREVAESGSSTNPHLLLHPCKIENLKHFFCLGSLIVRPLMFTFLEPQQVGERTYAI